MYFDNESEAIKAIKNKFGDDVALFGASGIIMYNYQDVGGSAKFDRLITGGETTRVVISSTVSQNTAAPNLTFRVSMVAFPYKES